MKSSILAPYKGQLLNIYQDTMKSICQAFSSLQSPLLGMRNPWAPLESGGLEDLKDKYTRHWFTEW
jgi:hypothetical protein